MATAAESSGKPPDHISHGNHVLDAAIDLLAGGAGATASVYLGQPLDTVKVKMQTFPELYRSVSGCVRQTYSQDGVVRGLYAGTLPSLLAQVSENAVLFLAYGLFQKAVHALGICTSSQGQDQGQVRLSLAGNVLAGGCAGAFAAVALCPAELVKCQLQSAREMALGAVTQKASGVSKPAYIGPWRLTRQILRTHGVPGLYKGMTATLLREMVGYTFFFGGYELTRTLLTPTGGSPTDIGPLKTVLCGGCGGVAFWVSIFPFDVIKTRVQVQTTRHSAFLQTLVHIARTEGVLVLYNGLTPTLIRTFPATGALFLAYETTKKTLNGLRN